jgi:hypothetical protein
LVKLAFAIGAAPVTVSVTVPPDGSVGIVTLSVPTIACGNVNTGQFAPAAPTHAVSCGELSAAGSVSVIVAPSAAAGPRFTSCSV